MRLLVLLDSKSTPSFFHQGEALHNINTKCCISSAESCISSIAKQLYIIKLRELVYYEGKGAAAIAVAPYGIYLI
jgi:hypothetical protein